MSSEGVANCGDETAHWKAAVWPGNVLVEGKMGSPSTASGASSISDADLAPTPEALERVLRLKYPDLEKEGWSPRMRHRFGYYTPDMVYETIVDQLVGDETEWLDGGCGRFLFPDNAVLAAQLSRRCRRLVGVDPDETLEENPYVHERVRCSVDEYQSDRPFDLVTLRMVAEHIANPGALVASFARLTKPGGRVVILTVFKWSPVPMITTLVPYFVHHAVKKRLWKTESRDTFPVANRMNTRGALRRAFARQGFSESLFLYADDCHTFPEVRPLHWLELTCHWLLRKVGLHYPEVCLIGVYTRR